MTAYHSVLCLHFCRPSLPDRLCPAIPLPLGQVKVVFLLSLMGQHAQTIAELRTKGISTDTSSSSWDFTPLRVLTASVILLLLSSAKRGKDLQISTQK